MIDLKISAKPIVWETEEPKALGGRQDWNEIAYGFWIYFDPSDGREYPYNAGWGEGDDDNFYTLKEAQEWCQKTIDDWMAENAVVTPTPPQTPQEPT